MFRTFSAVLDTCKQGGETVFPYQDTQWFSPEMAARAANFSSVRARCFSLTCLVPCHHVTRGLQQGLECSNDLNPCLRRHAVR